METDDGLSLPVLHATTHDTHPCVLHVAGPHERRHIIGEQVRQLIFAQDWTRNQLAHDTSLLSVVTWSDKPRGQQLAELCMDHLGIPYTTLSPPAGCVWENWLKIPLALAFAKACQTPYVMGIDADDVMLLCNPDEVLWRFLVMTCEPTPPSRVVPVVNATPPKPNCRLLFSAERNHYPRGADLDEATQAEKRLALDALEMPFCHLNAGAFIGETDAVVEMFGRAMEQPRSTRAPGSDQACWRRLWWRQDTEKMVDIDRRQEIFATVAGKYDPVDVVELTG